MEPVAAESVLHAAFGRLLHGAIVRLKLVGAVGGFVEDEDVRELLAHEGAKCLAHVHQPDR